MSPSCNVRGPTVVFNPSNVRVLPLGRVLPPLMKWYDATVSVVVYTGAARTARGIRAEHTIASNIKLLAGKERCKYAERCIIRCTGY